MRTTAAKIIFFQKMVYLKGLGLVALNNESEFNNFFIKLNELVSEVDLKDEMQKNELYDILTFILSKTNANNKNLSDQMIEKLIFNFQDFEKQLKLIQIKNYRTLDENNCLLLINNYINSYSLDKDVALIKLQILMNLEYEKYQGEIAELISFLNNNQ